MGGAFRDADDCATEAFCPESPDFKHHPDPASIKPADGAGRNRGTDWIVDVNCKHCGRPARPASTPTISSSEGKPKWDALAVEVRFTSCSAGWEGCYGIAAAPAASTSAGRIGRRSRARRK